MLGNVNLKKLYIAVGILLLLLTVILIIIFLFPKLGKSNKYSITEINNSQNGKNLPDSNSQSGESDSNLVNKKNYNNTYSSNGNNGSTSTATPNQTNTAKSIILSQNYKPQYRSNTEIPRALTYDESTGTTYQSYDSLDAANLKSAQNNIGILGNLLKLFYNAGNSANLTNVNIPSSSVSTPTMRRTSPSKLGLFILSGYSAGAKTIIANKPKIIKIMDPQNNPSLIQAAKDFKAVNPTGITILRIYNGTQNKKYTVYDDPINSAIDLYNSVIEPAVNALGADKQYFDYIETPNELDNTPGWESAASAAWLTRFWSQMIDMTNSLPLKNCIGSIPVNNPPGNYDEIKNRMSEFLNAVEKAKNSGGALCYHSYTLNYSEDENQELLSALRYRQIHQALVELNPGLSDMPFILSEAGVDQSGNPQNSGWQARGDSSKYQQWLAWFDREINKDNYVIGATLFQIGDGYWSSFDLEPIANWLSEYIR